MHGAFSVQRRINNWLLPLRTEPERRNHARPLTGRCAHRLFPLYCCIEGMSGVRVRVLVFDAGGRGDPRCRRAAAAGLMGAPGGRHAAVTRANRVTQNHRISSPSTHNSISVSVTRFHCKYTIYRDAVPFYYFITMILTAENLKFSVSKNYIRLKLLYSNYCHSYCIIYSNHLLELLTLELSF